MPLGTPMTTKERKKLDKTPGKVGRPPKIDEAAATICDQIAQNQTPQVACGLAKVSYSAFRAWLAKGVDAERRLLEGEAKLADLTLLERRCIEFVHEVEHADAIAKGRAVEGVIKGGTETSIEVKRHRKCIGLDNEGDPIWVEEETVTERPPDPKWLTWWLERRDPAYKPKTSTELTGADGGPIEIEFATRLAAVTDRIKQYQDAIPTTSQETT